MRRARRTVGTCLLAGLSLCPPVFSQYGNHHPEPPAVEVVPVNSNAFKSLPVPIGHGIYPDGFQQPRPFTSKDIVEKDYAYFDTPRVIPRVMFPAKPNDEIPQEGPYFAQFTKDEVRDNPNRLPYPRDDYNKMKDRRPLRPHVPGKKVSTELRPGMWQAHIDIPNRQRVGYGACTPRCVNGDWTERRCGPDGCGGYCGAGCLIGEVCEHDTGACIPPDVPSGNCSFVVSSHISTSSFARTVDPAIWFNDRGTEVLVLGTLGNKLGVFDRRGRLLKAHDAPGGAMVDVATLPNFRIGSGVYDTLVATSNNAENVVNFWRVTNVGQGQLVPLDPQPGNPPVFPSGNGTVSALALGRGSDNHPVAYIAQSTRNGDPKVAIVPLVQSSAAQLANAVVTYTGGDIDYIKINNTFTFGENMWTPCSDQEFRGSAVTGIAIDHENNAMYITQARVGLWRTTLDSPQRNLRLVEVVKSFGASYTLVKGRCRYNADGPQVQFERKLEEVVSGVSLYDTGVGTGWVLTSETGHSGFGMFTRETNAYGGRFQVSKKVGFVQGPLGLAATSTSLPGYPQGFLVAQDNHYRKPAFAYVDFNQILADVNKCSG